MASQQLHSYLGRAALWKNVRDKLDAKGVQLAPGDARALRDLCAGVTWMQRVPPATLASYRALYVMLRGDAAEAEEEINRDILRTVRGVTGLLLDFSQDQRGEFAGSINRVLNALALVDDMGYCQGQNYVVDVMMKAGLPERETFCLFLYLLRQGHLHGIYRKEVPMLAGYMDKFEEQLRLRLPKLAAHFEIEHYPPPLYALEWMTTLFGLAAQPLISLVALDLFLAGARNPVLRLCVSLVGCMEDQLLRLDQEGLLEEFRARAVAVDAEEVIVRAFSEGGGKAAEVKRSRAGADRPLGWSTGPDYLLVLRSRHCTIIGLVELREEARKNLLSGHTALQDALLAVTRSLGWGCLRTCWLESCLAASSDHERHRLANDALRFVITNGGHAKAAAFMLGIGGADANDADQHLLSPLHLVALYNRPDVARILLMCRASPRLAGGVTRAAAARGGKLWSPLEMAEDACTEGGELDEAGVAVGPAALYVLRGQICLQCNVKLQKPTPCGACQLAFCKSCQGRHFCSGKLVLPRGVPSETNASGRGGGLGNPAGVRDGRRDSGRRTLWALGSAIGDGWESLFSEGNANARGGGLAEGEEAWKPGRLRRAESSASRATTEEDADLGPPPRVWSTMPSVLLGTWVRRPRITSPRDRDKMLDNSAAFVRACYPAQTWLQHHMTEEMGLSVDGRSERAQSVWGGPFNGLGLCSERFDDEILRASLTTELHRRMSWVMAEAGVPWEKSDSTWCCPECFILFGFNVYRHHCRGCGLVYCSAHAPPTPIPPGDRPLKLCWSCVLEGAVPLPDPMADEVTTSISLSPTTARGIADEDSPIAAALATARGPAYVPPQPPSPMDVSSGDPNGCGGGRRDVDTNERGGRRQRRGERHRGGGEGHEGGSSGSGFLSAIVSLIEVVAAPLSPARPRASGSHPTVPRGTTPPATPLYPARQDEDDGLSDGDRGRSDRDQAQEVAPYGSAASQDRQGSSVTRPLRSPASLRPQNSSGADEAEPQDWRGGWSPAASPRCDDRRRGREAFSPPQQEQQQRAVFDADPQKGRLRPALGSSLSTASSTEEGEDEDDYAQEGSTNDYASNTRPQLASAEERETPAELGFPSERPWAYGFGAV